MPSETPPARVKKPWRMPARPLPRALATGAGPAGSTEHAPPCRLPEHGSSSCARAGCSGPRLWGRDSAAGEGDEVNRTGSAEAPAAANPRPDNRQHLEQFPIASAPASRSTSPRSRSRDAPRSAAGAEHAGAFEQAHAEQEVALRRQMRAEAVPRVRIAAKAAKSTWAVRSASPGLASTSSWRCALPPAACRQTPARRWP